MKLGTMDLASAEKAIRRGAVAGFITAGLTLLIVSYAVMGSGTGRLETWNDPWNFLDAALVFGLSLGLIVRSRVAAIGLVVYFIFAQGILFIETGNILRIPLALVFLYFFGRAVPATFVHHRLRREQDPEYRRPGRAAYFVWVPVGIVAVAFAGLMSLGGYLMLEREWGDPLDPGKPVSGVSGLYQLSLPDSEWVRVSLGTIGEDTDLELYGSGIDTWAIVFVSCRTDLNLDSVVDFRRDAIQADLNEITFSEERLMMTDSFLPVSYARYSGEDPFVGDHQISWVGSVVTEDAVIEVMAGTTLGPDEEAGIESLVKSLRLADNGGKPCGAS